MLICDNCDKIYHVQCLGHSKDWRPPEDTAWYCPACANSSPGTHASDGIIEVEWLPTWELESDLVAEGFQEALLEWKRNNHNRPPTSKTNKPLDDHYDNMHKQGFPPSNMHTWRTTIGDDIRQRVTFIDEPVNPQADTHPTGKHRIEIRTVDMWDPSALDQPENILPSAPMERACIYLPDGRCIASCTVERLACLYQLFRQALADGAHEDITPAVKSFETEIADLFTRNTPDYKIDGTTSRVDPKNNWSICPHILTAALKHFPSTKERFASPLNVGASTSEYWSLHARDQVFGARKDAYDTQWTGYSHAFPDYSSDTLEKATKWAIWSAIHASTPTATLLFLPKKSRSPSNPPHHKWIRQYPTLCKHLTTISHKAKPVWDHKHWMHGGVNSSTPLWDIEIVVVWNETAKTELRSMRSKLSREIHVALSTTNDDDNNIDDMTLKERLNLRKRQLEVDDNTQVRGPLTQAIGAQTTGVPDTANVSTRNGQTRGSDNTHPLPHDDAFDGIILKPPRKFRSKPRDTRDSKWTTEHAPRDHDPDLLHILLRHRYGGSHVSPLRWDWKSIAYTDGSCTTVRLPQGRGTYTSIGAGLYLPSRANDGQTTEYTINPRGEGPTKTINRAELAGIWGALSENQTLIATDSATSIAQIRKILLHPMELRNHKHTDLLEEIVGLIRASPHHITIMKIKAIIGILGPVVFP